VRDDLQSFLDIVFPGGAEQRNVFQRLFGLKQS